MSKRSSEYWKRRFLQLEETQFRKGEEYYKTLQEQFRIAENSIQLDIEKWYRRLAENNEISYMAAKKFIGTSHLEEFKWDVKQYIIYGEQNALNQKWMKQLENASARHHITYLEAMKLQVQQEAEILYNHFDSGMTGFLGRSYESNYFRTAYEIAKGTGVGSNLHIIDTGQIEKMIRKPWAVDGDNYSSRIWANKEKLLNSLNTELTQNIIRGGSLEEAARRISQRMNASRSQARRLVQTESAAISAGAQKDCFRELGVEEFEVVETLDGHTCDACGSMDGQHFPMLAFEVGVTAPPFHPNCRGCTCPYFNDEFTGGERIARNTSGQNYYVPIKTTYQEWKKNCLK